MNSSSQTVEASEVQPSWKQEVNAKVSAHRGRRGAFAHQPPLPGMEAPVRDSRAARVAARIAERYAAAPSYREVLAAEAARAAKAAEQAAREAQQAAAAVSEALRAAHTETQSSSTEPAGPFQLTPPLPPEPVHYRVDPASLPSLPGVWQGHSAGQSSPIFSRPHPVDPYPHVTDPFEEALVAPAQPLPARVLEFPRELVAARKARPRIAEGPLREGADTPDREQLRIFEVEPETISHQPAQSSEVPVPDWCSIRLDTIPRSIMETSSIPDDGASVALSHLDQPFSSRARRAASGTSGASSLSADMLPLHVAPFADRLKAAVIDFALIGIAFFSFLAIFLACTTHPPTGKPALMCSALALTGFLLLYQWLFFTFAEGTPGMRCAKIALCTFDDENPDRKSLQRRVGAACLAALPLGLGFLWVLLDEDRLGWHDRMTRTYQRSYR